MSRFNENINEFKKQLKRGNIQEAYCGLMEYIMSLRTFFSKKYPEFLFPSNIYFGYMDMTCFSFSI